MREVVYITDKRVVKELKKLVATGNRSEVLDEVVRAYGLLEHCKIATSKKCFPDDLLCFHSSDYVACLQRYNEECIEDVTDELLEYGLAYDCPLIKEIYTFATSIVGSTLAAVDAILEGTPIAINWYGGWHHAQKDKAAGFCYVNDIVIAIQKLRTKYQKVLYLDLDVHHGDGVEDAFSFSKYVMTVSFHQRESGYFPGSGAVTDIGFGPGKGYAVNAPYMRNLTGELFIPYFKQIVAAVYGAFKPNVCIVQCGADVIVGDRLGGTNLLPEDCLKCVYEVLEWNIPTIFLGGGGYNVINTVKYWTQLTALIVNSNIPRDIPDNAFFLDFGPDYTLDVYQSNVADQNTSAYLSNNICIIKANLAKYVVEHGMMYKKPQCL